MHLKTAIFLEFIVLGCSMQFIDSYEQWLDKIGAKLEKKKIKLYVNFIGPIVFIIFALTVLFLMPSQILLLEQTTITPRSFPTLLMGLILLCSVLQLVIEIVKTIKTKKPEVKEINALVEVKALILMVMLILYALLINFLGFILSSILFGAGMLAFFRVKNALFYLIIVLAAVVVGIFFQTILNVPLP